MKKLRISLTQKLLELSLGERICGLLITYILFIRFVLIFSYNTNLEGLEFVAIHMVQRLHLGQPLYTDPSNYPYLLVIYTPLYFYLMLGLSKLFSIDVINNIHGLYIAGRMISWCLIFFNYFILLKIIALLKPDLRYKLYVFLFLLFLTPVHFYTARPDSLKVTCFILFLFYCIKFIQTNAYKYHILSFFFILTGILLKQDVLIYGMLFYSILFLYYRRVVYVSTNVLLAAILIGLVYLTYLWSGLNLYKSLLVYNVQYDGDFHINIIFISIYLLRIFPFLFLAYYNLFSKDKLARAFGVSSFVFVAANLLCLLRTGSNFNYTYEACIVMIANGILYFKNIPTPKTTKVFYGYLFLCFLTIIPFFPLWVNSDHEKAYKKLYLNNLHESAFAEKFIHDDIVFLPSMDDVIFFPAKNIIYGYDWHFERYSELNLSVKLKPKFTANDIEKKYDANFVNGNVKYIIVENNGKSFDHIKKYYPGYELFKNMGNFLIFRFENNAQAL